MRIQTYPTALSVARAAVSQFIEIANHAILTRNRFSVALSGGSTPKMLYKLLADEPTVSLVDWSKVHIFWGDERTVPPDHVDSNYRMAYEALLSKVPIPVEQIHRIAGERPPELAALAYEEIIDSYFSKPHQAAKMPNFDLIFLGMGDDGHTASLFPESSAVEQALSGNQTRRVVTNYVEKFDTWRITLTASVINAASNVTFLVAGANKSDRLVQILEGPQQPLYLPAQLIQPTNGQLTWITDEAAAAKLS